MNAFVLYVLCYSALRTAIVKPKIVDIGNFWRVYAPERARVPVFLAICKYRFKVLQVMEELAGNY